MAESPQSPDAIDVEVTDRGLRLVTAMTLPSGHQLGYPITLELSWVPWFLQAIQAALEDGRGSEIQLPSVKLHVQPDSGPEDPFFWIGHANDATSDSTAVRLGNLPTLLALLAPHAR